MANIKLTLQYDGTRYLGWQRPEKDGYDKTVSYRLQHTLEKMTGEPITLRVGAKTDPGVHALNQIVSFTSHISTDMDTFRQDLNHYLPMDIRILDCKTAPDRFRADLNARTRTYEYRMCISPVPDIFTSAYETHIFPAPDIRNLKAAAEYLKGKHDFRFFSSTRKKKGTEKELTDLTFSKSHHVSTRSDTLTITLTANDFLYRMPALIIGTLLEIGQGTREPESILRIMKGTEKAGEPCPAKGLLLKSIQY